MDFENTSWRNVAEPNNPCHPNPTALVGDWLTREGNVIELVKVR